MKTIIEQILIMIAYEPETQSIREQFTVELLQPQTSKVLGAGRSSNITEAFYGALDSIGNQMKHEAWKESQNARK